MSSSSSSRMMWEFNQEEEELFNESEAMFNHQGKKNEREEDEERQMRDDELRRGRASHSRRVIQAVTQICRPSCSGNLDRSRQRRVYPKVKVRLHDQQEDQFSPQDDHRKLLLANIHAAKEIKSCSSPLLARLTMEAYAPKLPRQSISSSKENSKNLGKATTPDARACLVLRPRAVLSSPENDGMIGSINKIVDRKNSPAIKVKNPNTATSSAQGPHQEAKKAPSQAKKKATATARPVAMNTNKGSNIKTFFNSNNGDVKSKFQKPLVGKQHASLGTRKPSFTSS